MLCTKKTLSNQKNVGKLTVSYAQQMGKAIVEKKMLHIRLDAIEKINITVKHRTMHTLPEENIYKNTIVMTRNRLGFNMIIWCTKEENANSRCR